MLAKKNGIGIFFNPEDLSKFMDGEFTIYDNEGNELDDPEAYAQAEIEKNTHSGTIEDFLKWLEENGYTVTKEETDG